MNPLTAISPDEALRNETERSSSADSLLPWSSVLLDALPLAVTDCGNIVQHWTRGAEKLFGYPAKRMVGRSLGLLFLPEDRSAGAPDHHVLKILQAGRMETEGRFVRQDGRLLFLLAIGQAITGNSTRIAWWFVDLTRRKTIEDVIRSDLTDLQAQFVQRTSQLDVVNEQLQQTLEQLRREMQSRQDADSLRRDALLRISLAQEEAGRRISRELHDNIGQHLTALILGLKALEQEVEDQKPSVQALEKLAEEISSETHALAVQLRPTALEDLGLHSAITSYVEVWSQRSGLRVDLHLGDGGAPRLPGDVEVAVYRIIQEALTNIWKHAEARVVSLILQQNNEEITAIIEDDGRGFVVEEIPSTRPQALGLVGMHERAEQCGGTITIESTVGSGTTVYVRIPLSDAPPQAPTPVN